MSRKENRQNISERPLSIGERFLLRLVPWLIVTFQRVIGLTSRRVDIGREHLDSLRNRNLPWIYAIWHTNVLYSPYLNRNQNVAVMISQSKDGEYITRVVRKFGNQAIRGSTSKHGVAALKNMIRHLRQGGPAAITPDGPRGPAFKVQPGLVTSAQISQVPIVPFAYECTRQWIARNSWDQHRIPKPFTVFVVRYGEPIHVPPDLSPEDFEKMVEFVEARLLDNINRCREAAVELKKKESVLNNTSGFRNRRRSVGEGASEDGV